jgi:S1-C subfamily serine protease
MRLHGALIFFFSCPAVYCQVSEPPTQVDVCRKIEKSVVEVDTDTVRGSGFIVDSDGWIMTALHVVADPKTHTERQSIAVSLRGHTRSIPAEIVSDLNKFADRDIALLKINKTDLPALELGNEVNVEDGTPVTIVGMPLSAIFRVPVNPVPPFCLTGTVAAQTALPLGKLEFLHTIYFQGVSIKGISGAPIVSLVSGKVIGIVSTKLTGISTTLQQVRDKLSLSAVAQSQSGVSYHYIVNGIEPDKAVGDIVTLLDEQLANGLGTGTGASDAARALNDAKREYARKHLKK